MFHKMYFVEITGTVVASGDSGTIAFAFTTQRNTHKSFILYVGTNRHNRKKILVMIPIATTRKIDATVERLTDWICGLNGTTVPTDAIRDIIASRTTVTFGSLETFRCTSGTFITRPTGRCGNVGSSPYLWTAGYGKSAQSSQSEYREINRFAATHRGDGTGGGRDESRDASRDASRDYA